MAQMVDHLPGKYEALSSIPKLQYWQKKKEINNPIQK
jgi:hypothetical protein